MLKLTDHATFRHGSENNASKETMRDSKGLSGRTFVQTGTARRFESSMPTILQVAPAQQTAIMLCQSYVKFPDKKLPDQAHAYQSNTLARLMYMKRQYDPFNLFRFEQSIASV